MKMTIEEFKELTVEERTEMLVANIFATNAAYGEGSLIGTSEDVGFETGSVSDDETKVEVRELRKLTRAQKVSLKARRAYSVTQTFKRGTGYFVHVFAGGRPGKKVTQIPKHTFRDLVALMEDKPATGDKSLTFLPNDKVAITHIGTKKFEVHVMGNEDSDYKKIIDGLQKLAADKPDFLDGMAAKIDEISDEDEPTIIEIVDDVIKHIEQ